jgi:hypothetical protein
VAKSLQELRRLVRARYYQVVRHSDCFVEAVPGDLLTVTLIDPIHLAGPLSRCRTQQVPLCAADNRRSCGRRFTTRLGWPFGGSVSQSRGRTCLEKDFTLARIYLNYLFLMHSPKSVAARGPLWMERSREYRLHSRTSS